MSKPEKINATAYPGGVLTVDSGLFRPNMACCYLVEHAGEAAIIEAGGNSGAERLLAMLRQRSIPAERVRYVIVTHVHLDHAGGAGRLMQALPEATLLVHPRGARHMIDPSKLEAGTRAVYGDDAYEQTYGSLIPVPAERVRTMNDGETINWHGRELRFIDTPGHASHHFCVHDAETNGWFTGDTFGLSYRELDTDQGPFIFPTTTPIDFNPEALRHSIGRLLEVAPEWVYMTHFGRLGEVERLAQPLLKGIDRLVDIAERHVDHPQRKERIADDMRTWLHDAARQHGVTLERPILMELLETDVELNSQGLDVWLTRREKARADH